jgi:hypothetical protein
MNGLTDNGFINTQQKLCPALPSVWLYPPILFYFVLIRFVSLSPVLTGSDSLSPVILIARSDSFWSVLFRSFPFYPVLICSDLFCFVLSRSDPFWSVLFRSIPFWSVLICSVSFIPFYPVLPRSDPFCFALMLTGPFRFVLIFYRFFVFSSFSVLMSDSFDDILTCINCMPVLIRWGHCEMKAYTYINKCSCEALHALRCILYRRSFI